MIDYKGQLNLGNEALGTEKTITANEVLRTACQALGGLVTCPWVTSWQNWG